MKYSRLSLLVVSLFALSGCFSVLPLRVVTPAPYTTYKITKVVDAVTAQTIADNALVITLRRDGVEDIQFFSNDITEYNMQLPIGARFLVLIEAPGYQDWEMEIEEVKWASDVDVIEVQAEMVPLE